MMLTLRVFVCAGTTGAASYAMLHQYDRRRRIGVSASFALVAATYVGLFT